MSSTNNAVGAIAAYMASGTAGVNVSAGQDRATTTASANFDSILNKVSDTMIQSKSVDAGKGINQAVNGAKSDQKLQSVSDDSTKAAALQNDQSTNSANAVDTADAAEKANAIAQEAQALTEDDAAANAEIYEAINEKGEELISEIADTFDMSEEDIVNAMQVLGLMAADLLNPSSLAQLVTEITGQEEALDLITDSDIYTSLQDLMEGAESMKSELMNEFDLSEQEIGAAIENGKNSFNEQIALVEESEVEPNLNTKPEVTLDTATREMKAPVSEAVSDGAQAEEREPVVTVTSSKESDNKGNFGSGAESSNLYNQVMNNIAEAAADVDASATVSYTDRAQMEDIIRQITERISISANAEETSMELQLHPASLGNVNILLTSGKDGIIAKFTAQNEIVKEAVESQMIQLQQKFDEQGIKVTSIEVTIASHNFEENLEQGNDKQDERAAEAKKVKPLRRINLSDITDDLETEPESEAERIAVQMMEANGNSVDFSA